MNRFLLSTYKIGLVGGLFCMVAFLMFIFLEVDPTSFSMIFGYIILPVFLFLGIRYFRNYQNAGQLSFSEGMSLGFFIYGLIALLSGVSIWMILIISPSLFETIKGSKINVLENNREMISSQLGEDSFTTTMHSVMNMTAFDLAANDFIWKIVPGLFFTIIISIILRKLN
jgi:hypothetical protein